MTLWHALILGIVEGITEFLPISSTGHLILTSHLLGLAPTNFLKTFEIVIQLGAILSVVVLYWRALLVDFAIMKRVAAAFIPTGIIGFILYKFIKKFLLGDTHVVLWSLFLGGAALIVLELLYREKSDALDDIRRMPIGKAVLIGLFQSLAMVPGVSRSAATIIGGLYLGMRRTTIVEFSFLLAVPTMLAASGYDMFKSGLHLSGGQFSFLAVGFIASFVVAMFSIRFLLFFVKKNNFISFGIYRILLVVLLFKFF